MKNKDKKRWGQEQKNQASQSNMIATATITTMMVGFALIVSWLIV